MALKGAGGIAELGGIVKVQSTEALRSYTKRNVLFSRESLTHMRTMVPKPRETCIAPFTCLYRSVSFNPLLDSMHGDELQLGLCKGLHT